MAREVAEQPQALAATLEALLPLRERLRDLADGARDVLLVARGSSDDAAVYARYLLEVHAGRRAALAAPSVATHYRAPLDLTRTLVVSVSQSGSTGEIVATQEWARACGARTVAVTNAEGSPLAAGADLALVTRAGPERAVPATKTYTTQLAAMAVLGTALAPEPTALDAHLERAPGEVARLLERREGVEAAVEELAGARDVLVSGRGLVMGTALEVALKIEETCLRSVRGLSYADLRHGPIAVVGEGLVAVLVAAQDGPLVEGMAQVARDLAARGARTVGLGGGDALAAACSLHLPGPDLPEAVAPLALVVPAQLAVEALARRLGLDPDAPRGLSKVTQTDPGA
ncbi:SIS domain-containing protein [Quadrisphaera sp. DSM 44207]|uniref:SIS domain-containing protein n=1 Tax=Quadrisphaera sp. DSM 44207 TaxID=1881057 RepID=UPI000B87F75A